MEVANQRQVGHRGQLVSGGKLQLGVGLPARVERRFAGLAEACRRADRRERVLVDHDFAARGIGNASEHTARVYLVREGRVTMEVGFRATEYLEQHLKPLPVPGIGQ